MMQKQKYIKFTLIAFLLMMAFSISAQKQVLLEKFTNAYCGSCPNASLMIEELIKNYQNIIWVSHHKPVTWAENPLVNESSIFLWDELSVPGVPSAMIDRYDFEEGIIAFTPTWEEKIKNRLTSPEYLSFEIENVIFETETSTLSFDATITFNELPENGGPYSLTAMILEDDVAYRQHSYYNDIMGHPLEGLGDIMWGYLHQNVVRDILHSPWGEEAVIPESPLLGHPYKTSFDYNLIENYFVENMNIVLLVSKKRSIR